MPLEVDIPGLAISPEMLKTRTAGGEGRSRSLIAGCPERFPFPPAVTEPDQLGVLEIFLPELQVNGQSGSLCLVRSPDFPPGEGCAMRTIRPHSARSANQRCDLPSLHGCPRRAQGVIHRRARKSAGSRTPTSESGDVARFPRLAQTATTVERLAEHPSARPRMLTVAIVLEAMRELGSLAPSLLKLPSRAPQRLEVRFGRSSDFCPRAILRLARRSDPQPDHSSTSARSRVRKPDLPHPYDHLEKKSTG